MRVYSGLVILLLILITPTMSNACPSYTLSLRMHSQESDLIMIAKTLPANPTESDDDPNQRATLIIDTVIKGEFNAPTVEIYGREKYLPTDSFIAFLKWDSEEQIYRRLADNSLIKIETNEREIYQQFITEILLILEIEDVQVKNLAVAEWLVRCAEEPLLFHDACEDLMGSIYVQENNENENENENSEITLFHHLFSASQYDRLAKVFYSQSNVDYSHYNLVTLLHAREPETVENFLLGQLIAIQEKPVVEAAGAMFLLKEVRQKKSLEELFNNYYVSFQENENGQPNIEVSQQLLTEFIEKILQPLNSQDLDQDTEENVDQISEQDAEPIVTPSNCVRNQGVSQSETLTEEQ